MAKPGALRAIRQAQEFNADQRARERENTPVTLGEVTFSRRRKDWETNRAMRQCMREQEKAAALHGRLRGRVAELEVEQIEAAAKGETSKEDELEGTIDALVDRIEEATAAGELVAYKLLALLLIPPPDAEGKPVVPGFGPNPDASDLDQAIEFLKPLDVEDAADLAAELTGSVEPDPPQTPSNGNGSS